MVKQANASVSEKYLLSALDRISRNSNGYAVLYVSISKLKPKHRHPEFVKIFAKLFDSVVGTTKGSFFVLSNGDFVILGHDITQDMVDDAVKQLRLGLSNDPIIHNKDSSEFAKVYFFPEDFLEFYIHIKDMIDNPVVEKIVDEEQYKRPVEAAEIDSVIDGLNNFDVAEIVKHQSAIRIKTTGSFETVFQEFFVAVKDLSAKFDENLDLVANRWLFLYLTQELDKRTLTSFFAATLRKWPSTISVNLNLSSVFSKEFIEFAKNFLKPEQKIIVEVQMLDVFNNISLYNEAKDILHKGGHKLLIDGLNTTSLRMFNLKNLAPDIIKVFWEPLLEFDDDNQLLKNVVKDMGPDNVILAKCTSEKAIKWGVKHGIRIFQGPFMDDVEIAMIRSRCPNAMVCSAAECLKRKRLLLGHYRDECMHKELLEDLL